MSRSLGSYLNLSRNPVGQIRSFLSRAETREEQQGLLVEDQLPPLTEEDVSFVIINAEPGTPTDGSTSDPHRCPLGLSPVQIQYLKDKPLAVTSILRKLKDEGFSCKFDLEARKVDIRTLGGHTQDQALQIIRGSIVEMDFPAAPMALMDDAVDFLPPQEPGDLQALVVKVGSVVKLVGMADDMNKVGGSLRLSMGNMDGGAPAPRERTKEEIVPMTENCFTYLYKYKWTELKAMVAQFPCVTMTDGRNHVKLNGPSSAVDAAVKVVKEEMDGVKTFEINLGPQINVAVVAQVAQDIGKKHNCSITYQQNFGAMGAAPVRPPAPEFQSLSLSITGLKETRVRVVMNALEKQKAHVIVNTTNSKLELSQGQGVSRCVLQAAGPSIQTEAKQNYPNGVTHEEVAETGPGDIKTCRAIYHGSLPPFPKDKNSSDYQEQEDECFKWMVSLVFNCLIKASSSEKGYMTIALPALGTGYLEYPPLHVVQLMYKAIRLFQDDKRSGQIKDIIIVIYPQTKLEVKQMFLAHRQTYKLKTRHVASLADIHEENRKDEKKNCELRVAVGDTVIQVVNGNTHDACDVSEAVLVLWDDLETEDPSKNPDLVCTDPFRADWNCSSYVAELADSRFAADTTTLPRRTIVHCYCQDNSEKSVNDAIVEGMKNAVDLGCNTVTIPVASGGHFAKKPRASAQIIVNAVKNANSKICVVCVATQDDGIFLNFATKISDIFNKKLQEPVDVDKSPVAVDLWKKTYKDKASDSHSSLQAMMTLTNMDSVLLITSDSDNKNKMAAEEIQTKLSAKLPVVLEQQQTM